MGKNVPRDTSFEIDHLWLVPKLRIMRWTRDLCEISVRDWLDKFLYPKSKFFDLNALHHPKFYLKIFIQFYGLWRYKVQVRWNMEIFDLAKKLSLNVKSIQRAICVGWKIDLITVFVFLHVGWRKTLCFCNVRKTQPIKNSFFVSLWRINAVQEKYKCA